MKVSSSGMIILYFLFVQAGSAQTWEYFDVGSPTIATAGTRAVLTVDSDDIPHVAYYTEWSPNLFALNHALWNPVTRSFDIVTSYNFNPEETHLDITTDHNNVPHMTFHDHTAWALVHAYMSGGVIVSDSIDTPPHDGWASSIKIDSRNYPHVTFLPECCGVGTEGVEYAWFDGTTWNWEYIGSGIDIWLYNGTSLALDSHDNPHVTHYYDASQDLMYAVKSGGVWTYSLIDTDGDVGRYSSLQLTGGDLPRVAYVKMLDPTTGVVRHASFNGTQWTLTSIDTIPNMGTTATEQDMIALDLDSQGNSHIVYVDNDVLKYAVLSGGTVTTEVVADYSGDSSLSARVSLGLDSFDRPHMAYEVFKRGAHLVRYATRSQAAPVVSDIPDQTIALGSKFTLIPLDTFVSDGDHSPAEMVWTWTGNAALQVRYDSVRRRLRVIPPTGWTGSERITFTATDPDGLSDSDAATFKVKPASLTTGGGETGMGEDEEVSLTTAVLSNYPNPFNPTTTIRYQLAEAGPVRLSVYNVLGQEVVRLVDGYQGAGFHSAVWGGANAQGERAASGIYLYQLSAGAMISTGRMALAK